MSYVDLMNKAVSTESEDEAIACLRMIRKKSNRKARLVPGAGSGKTSPSNDSSKELMELKRKYNRLYDLAVRIEAQNGDLRDDVKLAKATASHWKRKYQGKSSYGVLAAVMTTVSAVLVIALAAT